MHLARRSHKVIIIIFIVLGFRVLLLFSSSSSSSILFFVGNFADHPPQQLHPLSTAASNKHLLATVQSRHSLKTLCVPDL
jgi:hypothetical protein